METTFQHVIAATYVEKKERISVFSHFINWCKAQEKYRFGWMAAIVTGHGCIITPLTLFAIVLAGNSFIFWPIALGAMAISLVANLAAMPTKVTIPIFFFSVLVDLIVIAICIANGFDINSTYII